MMCGIHDDEHEFSRRITEVAERESLARTVLAGIVEKLPDGMSGLVMVNADTGQWFNAKDNTEGWMMAKVRWGNDIAHPPVWTIDLAKMYAKREKAQKVEPAK